VIPIEAAKSAVTGQATIPARPAIAKAVTRNEATPIISPHVGVHRFMPVPHLESSFAFDHLVR
jgi:hypothetical protein